MVRPSRGWPARSHHVREPLRRALAEHFEAAVHVRTDGQGIEYGLEVLDDSGGQTGRLGSVPSGAAVLNRDLHARSSVIFILTGATERRQ
jgi:hypothetical protein